MVPVPSEYLPPLFLASMPPAVALAPPVFERPDVRRAEVAGVGGIFNARSEARFWAMLAGGGELDGVRLLAKELAATLNTPRPRSDEPDPVMFGFPIPITIGGFWFGGEHPPVCSVKNPRAICHPGQGGSIGWADPDNELAVAICHNRLFNPTTREEDAILPIADALREALGL
jgi:CubicO group peptidase (beta-lactamase class C family)